MKYKHLILSTALLLPTAAFAGPGNPDFEITQQAGQNMGTPVTEVTVKYHGPKQFAGLWCGDGMPGTMVLVTEPKKVVFVVIPGVEHNMVCYSSPSSSDHVPANKVFEFSVRG